jgi:hypothetical protein
MAEERYNLVFRGEILEGHPIGRVQKKLRGLLKIDADEVSKLFQGRPMTLKRGVDRTTALRYKKAFEDAGARLRVVARKDLAGPEAAVPEPHDEPADDRRQTRDLNRPVVAPAWELAPAGADLVRPEERAPQASATVPDVSHLSAAPANSGSLEDVVPKAPAPPPPDVSAISLAELGADLGESREAPPARVPQTHDLTLAEAGVSIAKEGKVASSDVAASKSRGGADTDPVEPDGDTQGAHADGGRMGLDQSR